MYIVGTSGHIDHGKTSLIRALTGIDCDRLPEEKEREMTIDIGFAMIEYPKFGTVSIIDVPGHERFIRNMVAGAWGIDCAMLVIDVNDGWMPQTEDHFMVLDILGVEGLIVVLNKIDTADEETIELCREEVSERLAGTRFAGSDLFPVSARTGDGIDALKTGIVENLRKLSDVTNTGKPYLFVDRVFSAKGHGTIITGTLKNGSFRENDTVFLLPRNLETRIKKIESHYRGVSEGNPSQRTALNLATVSREEVRRGDIIVQNNFFRGSDNVIVRMDFFDRAVRIRNNLNVEILIGTASIGGRLILIENIGERSYIARVRLKETWHFYPTESFVVTMPGGYRIVAGGRIIITDGGWVTKITEFKKIVSAYSSFEKKDIIGIILSIRHMVEADEAVRMFPDREKTVLAMIADLISGGMLIQKGKHLFNREYYARAAESVFGMVKENIGLNLKEIADRTGLSVEFASFILNDLVAENRVVESNGRYLYGDAITVEALPERKKNILEGILKSGKNGYELSREENDGVKGIVKDLLALGFVVSLDGNIMFHAEVYNGMKREILGLFDSRDKITVPEAKDAVGLSRKYIIPLLNRIESDGLIKRVGDFRIRA